MQGQASDSRSEPETGTAPTPTSPTSPPTPLPLTPPPPLGHHYDVDGRRLLLHRSGSASPSVVFLPGAGLIGLDYLNIHDATAAFSTSVLYDRAGTGWSDQIGLPRTAAEVADELHALLETAAVPGPHVLVGHSLGAFYARRFAQRFPAEVAGLLLLDPGHEDMFSYLPEQAAEMNAQMKLDPEQMPELTAEQVQAARGQYEKLYAQWPDSVRGPLIEQHLASWRTGLRETGNLEDEVYAELRGGGALPDVPLIVLTASGRNPYWAKFMSEELMRTALDGIRALHTAIAGSVPHGEHRALDDASHQYLHNEHPEAVLQAIRDLVGRAAERR